MEFTAGDVLRMANVALAVFTLVRLVMARTQKWLQVYTDKQKAVWRSFLMVVFTSGLASTESLINGRPLTVGSVLVALTLAFVLHVTYLPDDRPRLYLPASPDDRDSGSPEKQQGSD